MFRSLRVSTDYSIKISFIMDGHTLGVVDFTIAAEDRYLGYLGDLQHSLKEILDPQHRRLSTSTASSGFESRKVSTASSISSSMSASTFPTEEVDIEEESAVTRVRSDHHLEELINGELTSGLVVVVHHHLHFRVGRIPTVRDQHWSQLVSGLPQVFTFLHLN